MKKVFYLIQYIFLLSLFSSCVGENKVIELKGSKPENLASFKSTNFYLSNQTENSNSFTNNNSVKVHLSNYPTASSFCLSEIQTLKPTSVCTGGQGSDLGWSKTIPTSFILSNTEEVKTVYIWFKDESGLISNSEISASITLDKTPPTVSLSALSNATSLTESNYNLSGSCSDSTKVKLEISNLVFYVDCSGGTWSTNKDISGILDGNNISVKVSQTDKAGNISTTVASSFDKDTVLPTITVTSPTSNFYANSANQSSFIIAGTCSDDGVISISGSITDSLNCSSGSFSKSLDFSAISDGVLTLNLDTVDSFGNNSITQSISGNKDTIAPVTAFSSPSVNSYVNNSNKSNFQITGTCEGSNTINISGAVSTSVSCSGGTFLTSIDVSSLSEGSFVLNIDQDDNAGNSAIQISRSFIKDTIAPNLTQSAYVANYKSNSNQLNYSGACESGVNIAISGQENSSVSCSSGSWSFINSALSTDGSYSFSFSQTDAAGNSTLVSHNWSLERVKPSVNSVVISSGATYVGTSFVIVDVTATDASGVEHIRIKNAHNVTGDCQSEYADDSWQSFLSSPSSYSHQLSAGDGTKKVCVWVKDSYGNISVHTPTTGVASVDMDTVIYEVGNPPVITSFTASNNNSGSPDFGTTKVNSGDQLKINWTITDVEELSSNPVSLYYTTGSDHRSEWVEIVKDFGSIGSSQTSYADNYTSFNAPTSGYFRIKLVVKDAAGNTSPPAIFGPFNTGNWSVYAGTTDRGVGGSGSNLSLFMSHGAGQNAAVSPKTNDAVLLDQGYGIYHYSAITGKTSILIAHGTTNLVDGMGLDSNTRIDTGYVKLAFDSKGYLYILTNKVSGTSYAHKEGAVVWKVDLTLKKIYHYIGGGTLNDNSAAPSTSHVLFGPAVFDEADSLYYLTSCDTSNSFDRTSTPIRLMKVTKNGSSGASETVSIVAGDCTRGEPTTNLGVNSLTSPFAGGSNIYPNISSIAAWENGNKIFYCVYNNCYKINSGTTYKSTFNSYGIFYHHGLQKLYYSYGALYEVTPDFTASFNDTRTMIVSHTSSVLGCTGEVDKLDSCSKVFLSALAGPNGTIAFLNGAQNNSASNWSLKYIDSNDKIKTYVGSKPLYGDGLDKNLIRSDISGIYYKKATEPNQTAFPAGLYFVDQKAITLNYIDSSNTMNILAGNQTGSATLPSDGELMSTNISLGSPYSSGVMKGLTFGENGLPIMRVDSRRMMQFDSDKKVRMLTNASTSSSYFEDANEGDSAKAFGTYVFGGYNNLTAKDTDKVFYLGAYFTSTARTNHQSAELKLFDYSTDYVRHIMGEKTSSAIISLDTSVGGDQRTSTFGPSCDVGSTCFINYHAGEDRLYFSENTALRYITNPEDPATSLLKTLFTATRIVRNFIFSEDNKQVFYISSDGLLYCKDISSGKAWCNETSLGPATGMQVITSYGSSNQMTWLDSTTLLISNYKGQIYQYNLLP